MRTLFPILTAVGGLLLTVTASAVDAEFTVDCVSHNYQYNECAAGPLNEPTLIRQTSNASCILNNSWGFNPGKNAIWVNQGCSGIFADNRGYYHGQSNTYDNGARSYDDRGRDNGLLLGALLGAALMSDADDKKDKRKGKDHSSSNRYNYDGNSYNAPSGYDGCHGAGCLVDNPD